MNYCTLAYRHSDNVGDDIQSLAAEQYLPRIDRFIDRDTELHDVSEPSFVLMNGWFKHGPTHWRNDAGRFWPPAPQLHPGFIGFHIAYPELLTSEFLDYCAKWQPIGCRDTGTMNLLIERGIGAYFSRCLTLTFDRRVADPPDGRVYIVDGQKAVDRNLIPEDVRAGAERRNHYVAPDLKTRTEKKRQIARALLAEYRDRARLVITNLLHCAMPCVAMGVPVVFIEEPDPVYPVNYRLDPIRDLLPMYQPGDRIDWQPSAPDVSGLSDEIRSRARALVP
jgi:hypothetical protein